MEVYRLDIDPGEPGKWGKKIRWGRIVGFISGSIHLVLGFRGQHGVLLHLVASFDFQG